MILILILLILVFGCAQKAKNEVNTETYKPIYRTYQPVYRNFEACLKVPECPEDKVCGFGVCRIDIYGLSRCIKKARTQAKSDLISKFGNYVSVESKYKIALTQGGLNLNFKEIVKERNFSRIIPSYTSKHFTSGNCFYYIISVDKEDFKELRDKLYKTLDNVACVKNTLNLEPTYRNLIKVKSCYKNIDCLVWNSFVNKEPDLSCKEIKRGIRNFEKAFWINRNCTILKKISEIISRNPFSFNKVFLLAREINYNYFCISQLEFKEILTDILNNKKICKMESLLGGSPEVFRKYFDKPVSVINYKHKHLFPFAERYGNIWVIFENERAKCITKNLKTVEFANEDIPLSCENQPYTLSCKNTNVNINLCGCR